MSESYPVERQAIPGGCYGPHACSCDIEGDSTLQAPLRIVYCAKHAAAPALLEAVELVTGILEGVKPDCRETIKVARAAIAQAKGGR